MTLPLTAAGACRFCDTPLTHSFCDLGMSPLSNAFVEERALFDMERFYPLHALVCTSCFLVQLGEFEAPERIFEDYLYFSSYSESWLAHARRYVEEMTARLGLDGSSRVIEIASNDGYLLKNFVAAGIPALGVEPAANVAKVAVERGVPTRVAFFGTETADALVADGWQADLVIGNNVLAHVPALNDFVRGVARLLKPTGTATFEFPHLLRLMEENQFDTIYHEHFSYFSLLTVEKIFAAHDLTIVDVDELRTHGGSLRIHARPVGAGVPVSASVAKVREEERRAGLAGLEAYDRFHERVRETKRALLAFLLEAKRDGKSVVGYGAAAKGNTLLNYCGIRTDFLDYVVDRSPHKQGRFLPGTHVPVYAPERIAETRPDYVLILPWNLRDEVIEQMHFVREWGGRFLVPIPRVADV
jgi:SAM-dependent methyltransferase